MRTESLHPSIYRENALNALIEIRACYAESQAFVDGAFDRIERLIDEVRAQKPPRAPTKAQPPSERDTMQDQIDQLARLATELAHSVAEHKQMSDRRD
jgi:hypothetical protein